MKLRTNYLVVGIGCLALLACGMGWAQPAVPPFASPEAAGLNPLTFSNIDIAPDNQGTGGGGTRDVMWDSIGFDPVTGNAEFVYFGHQVAASCVPLMKVVSQAGIQHSIGGYLSDQGNDWTVDYSIAQQLVDPGFNPGWGFGGIQGDDITGDFMFTTDAGNLNTSAGGFQSWKQYVESIGDTLAGADYYPNDEGNNIAIFQRLDRDGGVVTPLTAGRNIPAGNINAGVDITSGSAFSSTGRYRIGGCAILSNGNNFYNIGDRDNRGTITFHGGVGANTSYGTISDAAGAYINTTTGTHHSDNASNPDGPVVSAGDGYIVNGVVNMTVMLNDMTIIYSTDTNVVYDGSDLALFPAGATSVITGFNCDDDETVPEAGPDIIYIPGRYTDAGGNTLTAIARFRVDVGAQTVTPLPILTPMDDLNPLPDSTTPPNGAKNGHTTQVDTNAAGDLAVVYRNPDDNTVIARVYNADGTPRTGSFYVSQTGVNDNLEELYTVFDPVNQNFTIAGGVDTEIPFAGNTTGGNAGKAAHSMIGFTTDGDGNDVIGVMWLTSSSVASANTTDTLCNGDVKGLPLSHAVRIISFGEPPVISGVDNWDLLN